MSRSANTERVRKLVDEQRGLAKKVDNLELDARNSFRFIQQLSDALLSLSQQMQAVSGLLDHLEESKQVTFPEDEPKPEAVPTPPAEPAHGS